MEDSTDVTRASRPARFKSRSCYDEMSSVFSRRGWSPICVHVKYAEEPLYIWEYTNTHISLTVGTRYIEGIKMTIPTFIV